MIESNGQVWLEWIDERIAGLKGPSSAVTCFLFLLRRHGKL